MREYLIKTMREIDFPEEAIESLTKAYDEIQGTKTMAAILNFTGRYDRDEATVDEMYQSIDELETITKEDGFPYQPAQMLYYLHLTKHLKEKYEKLGYSEQIYHDSIKDLRWKMFECLDCDKIWGSNVGGWDMGFYVLKLFAIGRLEYELIKFEHDFVIAGRQLKKGDLIVNAHIPSAGPLLPELCEESFRLVYEFFKKNFDEEVIPFMVDSWLLYPGHREFLPPTSNILKFMDFFTYVTSDENDPYGSWRIYGADCDKPFAELPERTGLQRAYKARLMSGGKVGGGVGVFLFDGKKRIN